MTSRYQILLRQICPTGKRTVAGLVKGEPATWEEPAYEPTRDGETVLRERRSHNLTVADAAERLGLTVQDVSDLETGRAMFAESVDLTTALIRLSRPKEN